MESSKKVIKAASLEKMGARVETVDLGGRKFTERVFKSMPVDENPVEMEEAGPEEPAAAGPEAAGAGEGESAAGEQPEQVKLERFHDEEGVLIGLRVTCKCGEVIDLEFTRD
ncbi:MAG: hypothetical protein JXQ83_08435 [Candidatus Glassbacteria bacterium]|nr:hypothetical protein [Candidatus Glassbacteria bacterium]